MVNYYNYSSTSQADKEVIILTDTLDVSVGVGPLAKPTVGSSNNWIALVSEGVDEGVQNQSQTKFIAGRGSYNPATAKHQGDVSFTGRVIKRSSIISTDVNKIKAILEFWLNVGASSIYVFHSEWDGGTVKYIGYAGSASVVLDSTNNTYGLNSYFKARLNNYKFHHKPGPVWTVDIKLDECNT